MRVLVSDYEEQMEADYTLTIEAVKEILPDADVIVEPYGTERFYQEFNRADGWITAFVPVERELLQKAEQLRCISQNAVGYSNVCMEDLKERGIALCHIEEYCTREVAEHAVALMLALNHNLSRYAIAIRDRKQWDYKEAPAQRTLNHKTLAVFGLGRIGRVTAELAKALGMKVMAVDPYVSEDVMEKLGVTKAEKSEALKYADVLINHMALTEENYHYFDEEAFRCMERMPFFINVGRGGCVDETALEKALEQKRIAGAGLDVLESEQVDVNDCPLSKREDVILTPHSAFYSVDSVTGLHTISGHNLAWYLSGQYDRIQGLVYQPDKKGG
ncbi:MAG: NAD(P)-dependent oxidoreductase [Lachnospiraceae bacterium]